MEYGGGSAWSDLSVSLHTDPKGEGQSAQIIFMLKKLAFQGEPFWALWSHIRFWPQRQNTALPVSYELQNSHF